MPATARGMRGPRGPAGRKRGSIVPAGSGAQRLAPNSSRAISANDHIDDRARSCIVPKTTWRHGRGARSQQQLAFWHFSSVFDFRARAARARCAESIGALHNCHCVGCSGLCCSRSFHSFALTVPLSQSPASASARSQPAPPRSATLQRRVQPPARCQASAKSRSRDGGSAAAVEARSAQR